MRYDIYDVFTYGMISMMYLYVVRCIYIWYDMYDLCGMICMMYLHMV